MDIKKLRAGMFGGMLVVLALSIASTAAHDWISTKPAPHVVWKYGMWDIKQIVSGGDPRYYTITPAPFWLGKARIFAITASVTCSLALSFSFLQEKKRLLKMLDYAPTVFMTLSGISSLMTAMFAILSCKQDFRPNFVVTPCYRLPGYDKVGPGFILLLISAVMGLATAVASFIYYRLKPAPSPKSKQTPQSQGDVPYGQFDNAV